MLLVSVSNIPTVVGKTSQWHELTYKYTHNESEKKNETDSDTTASFIPSSFLKTRTQEGKNLRSHNSWKSMLNDINFFSVIFHIWLLKFLYLSYLCSIFRHIVTELERVTAYPFLRKYSYEGVSLFLFPFLFCSYQLKTWDTSWAALPWQNLTREPRWTYPRI